MPTPAVVLAHDHYMTANGKVAHGLVRSSRRFDVVAVVDPACSGSDAGELLDGHHRAIPVVATLTEGLAQSRGPVEVAIVGFASPGGRLTEDLVGAAVEASSLGLTVISGLHHHLADNQQVATAAAAAGTELIDVRRAPAPAELHFWEGTIAEVRAPRLAVLGMDCAIGKRTTARMIVDGCNHDGLAAAMVYTGQTGFLQDGTHGLILDSIPNDFVSGELERAVVEADRALQPEVIVLEGQSSLRNPSGPCGSELLLSAAARGVVLQHAPGREYFHGLERGGYRIPTVASEIDLIAQYGAATLAVTLNDEGLTVSELAAQQESLSEELGIPVLVPLRDGIDALVELTRRYVEGAE